MLNVTDTDDEWWEGYCTLNPFVKGVFPASFVELLVQESTASVLKQSIHQADVPVGASPAAAVRKQDGSLDRDSVRQMLWELGVDSDTLAQVGASLTVAERRQTSGAEVLDDVAPSEVAPDWMGLATLVEALDLLDESRLKQICKDLNVSWKGSKGDLIARLEVHVAAQGGQYPPKLEQCLKEKQDELDAINMQPEAVRVANRCALWTLLHSWL